MTEFAEFATLRSRRQSTSDLIPFWLKMQRSFPITSLVSQPSRLIVLTALIFLTLTISAYGQSTRDLPPAEDATSEAPVQSSTQTSLPRTGSMKNLPPLDDSQNEIRIDTRRQTSGQRAQVRQLPVIPESRELSERLQALQQAERSERAHSVRLPTLADDRSGQITMPLPVVATNAPPAVPELRGFDQEFLNIDSSSDDQPRSSDEMNEHAPDLEPFDESNREQDTEARQFVDSSSNRQGTGWASKPVDRVPTNIDPTFIPGTESQNRGEYAQPTRVADRNTPGFNNASNWSDNSAGQPAANQYGGAFQSPNQIASQPAQRLNNERENFTPAALQPQPKKPRRRARTFNQLVDRSPAPKPNSTQSTIPKPVNQVRSAMRTDQPPVTYNGLRHTNSPAGNGRVAPPVRYQPPTQHAPGQNGGFGFPSGTNPPTQLPNTTDFRQQGHQQGEPRSWIDGAKKKVGLNTTQIPPKEPADQIAVQRIESIGPQTAPELVVVEKPQLDTVAYQEPINSFVDPPGNQAIPGRHPLATYIARQEGLPPAPVQNAPYQLRSAEPSRVPVIQDQLGSKPANQQPVLGADQLGPAVQNDLSQPPSLEPLQPSAQPFAGGPSPSIGNPQQQFPPPQFPPQHFPPPQIAGNGYFATMPTSELNLVQPPIAQNRIRPYTRQGPIPAPQNDEQFWNQFSQFPENKKERTSGYDSFQAVLNNGFWFAGIDFLYLEPLFQENNAFATTSGGNASSEQVDFGFDVSYRGHFGFQTNAGPAFKASFWRLNNFSAINDITIGAGQTAITRIDLGDSDNQLVLGQGAAVGSRLTVQQQMKINSTEVLIFKDQQNPISRVRGNIGLRHISLQQLLFTSLDDPVAGSQVVRNFNDYFGAGPKIGIEYFRPIGHTDLELQAGMFGSVLFGRRDQILDLAGATPLRFSQLGKVEAISIFEMHVGVQWNIKISDCQHFFVRSAIESQLWAGSDSALDIGSDFGLYGASFSMGLTR